MGLSRISKIDATLTRNGTKINASSKDAKKASVKFSASIIESKKLLYLLMIDDCQLFANMFFDSSTYELSILQ